MTEDTQLLTTDSEIQTDEIFQEYEVDMNDSDNLNVVEDEIPKILRTPSDGCFEVYESYWGKYIRPCFDPEANVEITKDHLEKFELNPNVHKIQAELWSRWVKLCFHFVDKVKNSVEVSVRILRSEEDPSKYRILVPKQVVSGAAVRVDSFDESIDIETGEVLTQYPPEGWIPVGSSHSHNTMPAFFSGTDDKYELGDPGIHLVVGGIKVQSNTYEIAASVVGSGRRFKVSYKDLIDASPVHDVQFHPKVVDYVDYESPISTTVYRGNPSSIAKSNYTYQNDTTSYQKWLEQYSGYMQTDSTDYKDPFYYNGTNYSNVGTFNSRDVKMWEVEDLTVDYIKQSQFDINKLFALLDFLQGTAKDVEGLIDDMMYSHQS